MSIVLPTLEVITGFATGTAVASLDLIAFETTERLDNLNTATARVAYPFRTTVSQRTPLRAVGADGVTREYRVTRIVRNVREKWADLEMAAPLFDLGTAGFVRQTVNGQAVFAVNATLTLSQWLTTYILTNLSADGLSWLDTTPGTVNNTASWPISGTRFTRLALLQALAELSGQEFYLTQPVPGGLYRIAFESQRGSSGNGKAFAFLKNLQTQNEDRTDTDLVSIVSPFGAIPSGSTEAATLADNLWSYTGTSGDGYLQLADPNGGAGPIGFDSFLVGAYVEGPINSALAPTRSQIIASRASDHGVTVTPPLALTAGDRVRVVADSSGNPLIELARPSALSSFTRIVQPLELSSGRGEANRILNGRFQVANLYAWTAANAVSPAAYCELQRSELGTTVIGAANGARAAGTGTGTPLSIRNLAPGSWVRQQDELQIGNATCVVTADTIPSSTGTMAIPVSPGLPGSFADNTAISLIRREVRSVTAHSSAQSPLSPFFWLAETNTENLQRAFGPAGLTLSGGGYTLSVQTWQWENAPYGNRLERRSGRLLMRLGNASSLSAGMSWASSGTDVGSVTPLNTSNDVLLVAASQVTVGAASGFTQISLVLSANDAAKLSVGSRVRYKQDPNTPSYWPFRVYNSVLQGSYTYWTCIVVSKTGNTVILEGEKPFGTETVMLALPDGHNNGVGQAYTAMPCCSVLIPANTAMTWSQVKETRSLNLNGAHSSGATTVNTKAVAIIARRDWQAGDTLSVWRNIPWRVVTTGVSLTRVEDGSAVFQYWEAVFTLNTSLTTLTDAIRANAVANTYSNPVLLGVTVNPSGTTNGDIISISGSSLTARFYSDAVGGNVNGVQDISSSSDNLEAYTVASPGAAWQTNGTATVPLTAAIPTGRSYLKGLEVKASWQASTGFLHLGADLSAGATTVSVTGNDSCSIVTTSPNSQGTYGLYRVTANNGSTIPIQGNTMYAAASAQANASGVVSVTPTAANTNAITDGAQVSITRPALIRAGTDVTTGSVIRLLYAPGNNSIPLSSTPGVQSSPFYVSVPSGGSRVVTALVTVAMNAGTYTLGQFPCIGLHDAAGNVLAYARVSDGTVTVNNVAYVRLICSATLTASQAVYLRIFGGFSAQPTSWHVVLDAMVALTAATDVPYVEGSWANVLWQTAVNYLSVYGRELKAIEVGAADIQFVTGAVNASLPPLGATVKLEDTGDSVRLVGMTVDHFDYTRTKFTFDSLRETAARLLGARS